MQTRLIALLLFIYCLPFCAPLKAQASYLSDFYTPGIPNYLWAFGPSEKCNPIVGMSNRTKNFRSPSKLAIRGLEAIITDDISTALACEKQLKFFEKEIEGGLFYVFLDDYKDNWPFHLKAPWVSAFTQGIALELYIELAKKTGAPYYKKQADKIYLSYTIPINKGGFSRHIKDGVIFEEYPVEQEIAVLNGDLIALIALYDYANYSNKEEPKQLAEQAVNWLQKNINRFVIKNINYAGPISAYSLAPPRLDVLFRFYLTNGSLDIFYITLSADNISQTIKVGYDQDDDISRTASLIISPDMNWSKVHTEITPRGSKTFRKITENIGSFNHAPFRIAIKSPNELKQLNNQPKIKVAYRAYGNSDLQISDGKTFYKIGTLPATAGKIMVLTFDIPQTAIANLNFPNELKYNALYFEHNQKLLGIVSEITGSEILKKHSDLLKR